MQASSGSSFSMPFPFLTICSFTFVALSSFSRGKDTEISREGKTNTGFSRGKGTHTDFAFILLHVSVHMHCFVTASDSECRSSEAVVPTAHCFINVHIALVSNRKSSQAIFNLTFAPAFR